MKKKISATAAAVACLFIASAQNYPASLPNHVVDAPIKVHFVNTDNGQSTKCEVPPWIIPGGWRSYFFVDGTYTYIYSSPKSIVDNTTIDLKDDAVGPYMVAQPAYKDGAYPNYIEHWRLAYHNIYSAHYINHPQQGTISVGFLHSENKNRVQGNCFSAGVHDRAQNTFNPSMVIDCYNPDSYTGDGTNEAWIPYSSLLTAAWVPNNQSTNWGQQYFINQLGPIAWPSNGYLDVNGSRVSNGVGHPSSIIVGDYVYIYYLDVGGSIGGDGRRRGIRVLKVHKNDALDPTQYNVYYKDPAGNVSWNPALPAGFTKENLLQYVSVLGPQGSDVLNTRLNGDNTNTIRFSVAKVLYTDYYVGVEEYMDDNELCPDPNDGSKHKMALRFSDNLLDWSDRILQIGGGYCWDDFQMRFPILLNSDGWSNTEVNLNDFYILGAGNIEKNIYRIRVHYYVPPPDPGPGPFPCPPGRFCTIEPEGHGQQTNKLPPVTVDVYPVSTPSVTNIRLTVAGNTKVTMVLFDATGRLIEKVEDRYFEKGKYMKQLNMSSKIPGIYFLQVRAGNTIQHLKIVRP